MNYLTLEISYHQYQKSSHHLALYISHHVQFQRKHFSLLLNLKKTLTCSHWRIILLINEPALGKMSIIHMCTGTHNTLFITTGDRYYQGQEMVNCLWLISLVCLFLLLHLRCKWKLLNKLPKDAETINTLCAFCMCYCLWWWWWVIRCFSQHCLHFPCIQMFLHALQMWNVGSSDRNKSDKRIGMMAVMPLLTMGDNGKTLTWFIWFLLWCKQCWSEIAGQSLSRHKAFILYYYILFSHKELGCTIS